MKSLTKEKGSITVFLSLSIMIILSLVLALFQGARIGAVRMKTECVADIATNSVLSEYSRELYEQYGLLMVDSSIALLICSFINSGIFAEDFFTSSIHISSNSDGIST